MSDAYELSDETLALLGSHPEGTRGHVEERLMLRQLRSLCCTHGFALVAAAATGMEELYRDPASAARHRMLFRQRVAATAELVKKALAVQQKAKVKA